MKEPIVCEECKANPSKYKCPGCSINSCSLSCVKTHKQRTGCTGKRKRTEFVPLSQFDDNQLLSDYNLLEEVKRVAESAQRLRNKLCRYNFYRLPFHLKSLRSASASRRTKLLFLPSGMSGREKNQTRYDQRKKTIFWTIEWRFHLTDTVLLDHGVNENMDICSVIGKHLEPGPWNHQLRQFSEAQFDSLKLFLRKYPKSSRSPFYELDATLPIRQQLTNKFILEYPVIYVAGPSQIFDFEVIKDVNPSKGKPELKGSQSNGHMSPAGIHFKEEEIEDNGSLDPQVFDLTKHENLYSLHQYSQESRTEMVNKSSDRDLASGAGTSSALQSMTKTKKQDLFDDMDFEFDQGLIDAYSDLIAEINPDDFLDFEGEFSKEEVVGERIHPGNEGFFLQEDDIEEGEILE